jgi:AraC-like DNA-binding protein
VEAGSLVFLNQFDEHATRMISDVYRRYYLLIPQIQLKAFHNDVLLLSVFRFHGDKFSYVLPAGADKPRFDTYFALLKDAADRGGAYMDERIEALMTLILADALALRPDMFVPAGEVSFLPMQDILDELDRSFADGFSLGSLAAKFHVSPGCLSAHFRHHVGMSPMQYITQSRLTHARVLLDQTEMTVMEISMQCGYHDVSNFVRRFRHQFQMTPLQFRRQRKGSSALPRHKAWEA